MNATEIAAVERAKKMQDEFQSWAGAHGGLRLTLADRAATLLSQTYLIWETELAWRAWANSRNAIAPPVAAGSVDTPAFRKMLPMFLPENIEKWSALVAFLDAHTAQLVADARAGKSSYATRLEQEITRQHEEVSAFRQRAEKAEAEREAAIQWRRLAMQFDGHRMQAMWHLKAMLQDAVKHTPIVEQFLAAGPLSGEKVLADRIAALAQVASGQVPVRDEWITPQVARHLDGQYRNGFADGWNAGVVGDESALARANNRVGTRAEYAEMFAATPQPAPVAGPDERAAFEQHLHDTGQRDLESTCYWSDAENSMWDIWQARAAIAKPPAISTSKGAAPAGLVAMWPAAIYLTPGCDPLPDFSECAEVSWCAERIGDSDVRYVRDDLAPAPGAEP